LAGEVERRSSYSPAGPDTGGSFARPNRGSFNDTANRKIKQVLRQAQDKKGDEAYGKDVVGNQREWI